jgi:intron-binding protein aquarius
LVVDAASSPFRDPEFVRELICEALVARDNQLEELSMMSLFPSEELLWDETQLPLSNTYTGEQVLSLPKLNLQFLTIHDYLLRNFTLFRLESAYEIRDDLTDAIKRMGPREGPGGKVAFGGWARMALPIAGISIDEVGVLLCSG